MTLDDATSRWIVTPAFFEREETALLLAAPKDALINEVRIVHRSPPEMRLSHQAIKRFVEEAIEEGHRPISLAGDCCAALPVMAGLQTHGIEPDLVWIDAHGDFNTPDTSPSQFLGGMPLAMMVGRGPQWMMEGAGATTIAEDRVLLVGTRDIDPLEEVALRQSLVTRIPLADLAEIEFDGPVHLHLDLDVIDSAECPGFSYPAPGGPSVADLEAAMADLAKRTDLAAISISGWTGELDPEGITKAAAKRVFAALMP